VFLIVNESEGASFENSDWKVMLAVRHLLPLELQHRRWFCSTCLPGLQIAGCEIFGPRVKKPAAGQVVGINSPLR
jgi:hypothetical protein